jgi:lipopolysaccharide export system protein LptC
VRVFPPADANTLTNVWTGLVLVALSRRELILMVLFLLVGVAAWWQLRTPDQRDADVGAAERKPDYVVEGLRGVTLDAEGRPTKRLEAERLRHYPDDRSSELDAPSLWVYSAQGPPWQARARSAWMNADADEVLLQDDVRLSRAATSAFEAVELRTSELLLLPEREYAETSQFVEIEQAGGDRVSGSEGMRAWFGAAMRVQVFGRVRARLSPQAAEASADPVPHRATAGRSMRDRR